MKILDMIIAVLAIIIPLVFGYFIDYAQLGVVAGLAGLMLSQDHFRTSLKEQFDQSFSTALASGIAFIAGLRLTGHFYLSLFAIPVIIFTITTLGRFSRKWMRASVLFSIFLVIGYGSGSTGKIAFVTAVTFILGIIWVQLLLLIMHPVYMGYLKRKKVLWKEEPKRSISNKQLWLHWKKGLKSLKGWQFQLRLTLCIVIAQIIRYFISEHHTYWILLTITIVIQYNLEHSTERIVGRSMGTLIGVCISMILAFLKGPAELYFSILVFLTILRSFFSKKNYFLYSLASTPLIMALLGFGKPMTDAIFTDRIFTTCLGCIISFIFGYYIWKKYILKPSAEVKK
ncbi:MULTISPECIES: FUSC family protein [Chryseobacterium]|uniref:Uncharacterized membrane protein YgaE (UPF0421/DUF939 family) n=1 Tax=Chryseobacterium camelliae TaxID=1265445 RepID=A0ABU0TKN3_9FLAO|nr:MULTISPECIES: FUSC family protein [Chryseobacterium]MDT3408546.1 uncharacterized membrane protein YgaE (UPF0421/DUF939 family) [Pseudacidovorax intermedius]MDQ1097599.1 uncharacterized membrane protein YgaE (UPF0421/DUF939 family) [Chryseobacterium camelliae]MDQ1101528.1 uncharacterized membrane protein YgaE (UPF0421/DUF939 family) [Chryseobacterium sp. SORGH_AS_1048]MDR6084971.1 uncharacterized membrane protein YgaE (UPF0421/DUF939 family) [Chryseobacterium sp. SORGH_AS_0909]MDR6129324.1 u